MRLDRVVLQKNQYPLANAQPAPPGWTWVIPPTADSARQIYVLERVDGLIPDDIGRVVATVDATAASQSSTADSEKVTVSSPTGGSVVFARLAWPGYSATLNGEPLQTKGLGDIFLYVDLPPGTDNAELEISFRPPGQRLGLVGIAGGLLMLAVLVGVDVRRRRSERASTTLSIEDITDPDATERGSSALSR